MGEVLTTNAARDDGSTKAERLGYNLAVMESLRAATPTTHLPIEVVDAFEEFGWDCPHAKWKETIQKLAPAYSVPVIGHGAASETAALLIARCKVAFLRGQRAARKYKPAITKKARAARLASKPR